MKIKKMYSTNISMNDLLWDMLLAFISLFVLTFAMMAQSKQVKSTELKGEFLIIMSWQNDHDDDMDIYVEDPNGSLVMFRRREDGLMHLDRDDLGAQNDIINTPLGKIEYKDNREIVTIRGLSSGEFSVSCHAFNKRSTEPTTVNISVEKINPYSVIATKSVVMEKTGEEKMLVRFTVDSFGKVSNVNTLEKSLVNPAHNIPEVNDNVP
jgi:hypothetical protein